MTKITENDIEFWAFNTRSVSLKQGVWPRKQGLSKVLNPFVFSGFSLLSKFYSQLSKVHMGKVISDINTIFPVEYLQTQKEGHVLFDGDIDQISFWGPKEDSSFFKEVYNSIIYVLINKVLGSLRRCFEYVRKN